METGHALPEEMGVVDGEEIVFEQGQYEFEYDSTFNLSQERNLLFELYQPEETASGTFVCKICLRTGKEMEFTERNAFVAHRYKCHGSYNNTTICPVIDCREVFASMGMLRRHLNMRHLLPCEVHQQAFANVGEFEKWRHLVELSSGCRYMMHTKQPKLRRQIMHCAKSEHKLILQTTKHRLPRVRMAKEGACCPAHISFRIDAKSGEVHSFCQLYHYGHASGGQDEPSTSSEMDGFRPIEVYFPMKPKYAGDRQMQFVQIDTVEMPTAIYGASVYETILIVNDVKSGFLWARPLSDVSRSVITRMLTTIFSEYGVPEGFSTCFGPTYVRDSMKSIENIYGAEIREVWNEPISYDDLEQWLVIASHDELGSSNRWVEQLQFVVMEFNQRERLHTITPFERMFNRKPRKLFDSHDEEEIMLGGGTKQKCDAALRLMERDALTDGIMPLAISYQAGERVYLRRVLKKPARGNNLAYLYGYIAEVDDCSPHFPYKVHYSSNDSPWPNESSIYAWASPYDILPTTHRIRSIDDRERQKVMENLFCVCSGEVSSKLDTESISPIAKSYSRCPLYRNVMCSNRMSRVCCKVEGELPCAYHEIYPESDDSYVKLELALVTYNKLMKDEAAAAGAAGASEADDTVVSEQIEVEELDEIENADGHHVESVEFEYDNKRERQESASLSDVNVGDASDLLPQPERMLKRTRAAVQVALAAATTSAANSLRKRKNQRETSVRKSSEPVERKRNLSTVGVSRGRNKSASSPTPSLTSSIRSCPSPSRRQSSRRSVKPKNFVDYVE